MNLAQKMKKYLKQHLCSIWAYLIKMEKFFVLVNSVSDHGIVTMYVRGNKIQNV